MSGEDDAGLRASSTSALPRCTGPHLAPFLALLTPVMSSGSLLVSGMLGRVTILLILLCALDTRASELHGVQLLQRFSPDDYGASGMNMDIAVHSDGRVFAANYDGVLYFDGSGWNVFRLPGGRAAQLLERGPDGRIYVAGPGHIGVLDDARDGSLHYTDLGAVFGLSGDAGEIGTVTHVLAAESGVWFNTRKGLLLYAIGADRHRIQNVLPQTRNPLVVGDTLYTRVHEAGLMRLRDDEWMLVQGGDALAEGGITGIHAWQGDLLLIGVDAFHLASQSGIRRLSAPMAAELKEPYYKPSITTQDGELLIGAATGHVLRYNAELQLVERIPTGHHIIRELAQGPEGDVWIATEGGLARLPPSGRWSSFDATHGIDKAILDFDWHNGALWLATARGLQRIQPLSGGIPQADLFWSGDAVTSLHSTSGGLLFSRAGALNVLERDASPRVVLKEPHAYIGLVSTAQADADHLYAYSDNVVWLLRLHRGQWDIAARWELQQSSALRGGVELAPGELWFGSAEGGPLQLRLDLVGNRLLSQHRFGSEHGLVLDRSGSRVSVAGQRLYVLSGDDVFVMDQGRFVPERGSLHARLQKPVKLEGLVTNEDGDYALTQRQLIHRPSGTGDWHGFKIAHGTPLLKRARVGSDGTLRVLTQSGELLQYDSTRPDPPPVSPLTVRLTGVRERSKDGELRSLPLPNGDEAIRLPVGSALEVSWGLVSMEPGTQFRVRVDGMTSGWSSWLDRGRLETLISRPGRYLLELDANVRSGRSVVPITLRVDAIPAWYQTGLVRSIGVALMLLSAACVARRWLQWRTRRYDARQRELEARIAERTAELEIANTLLAELAVEDALTGVANRRALEQALLREWSHCLELRQCLAVLMIDVDHFKRYNDAYGHLAGDAALREVATRLKQSSKPPRELLARYGGEEFSLLMPATSLEEAARRAEALRAHVANGEYCLTVSIGVAACVPAAEMDPVRLLKLADDALYRAKRNGRDRVERFQPEATAPVG